MSDTVNTLEHAEPLIFISECLPQLAAGNYVVTAGLEVNSNKDFESASKDFWVDAPRFVLDQSDIYTVYPAKGATGHFETTLPHIVLNRRTLPWERTIDGKTKEQTAFIDKDSGGHAPWMGLLLLDEEELKGTAGGSVVVEQLALKDVFSKNTAEVFAPEISAKDGPKPALTAWEKMDSNCQVIEMPLSLFNGIAPQRSDLSFLSHVRKVKVDGNKESADIGDDGYFSTIVCNRLPVRDPGAGKARRNTVFLVSFEGFHNYFNNPGYITKNRVRLVVLTSWSFTVAPGKNFKELCENLRVSPFKMNYPEVTNAGLKTAYDYGYTLLPHQVRDGAGTYSWYRGPFNPNFLPANPKTRIFASADNALRFDEDTGLFDVSYAAAWQLGRLLALKDKVFSNGMYQWKTEGKKKVLKEAARQQVSKLFPDTYKPVITTGSLEDTVKDFLNKQYNPASDNTVTPKGFDTAADKVNAELGQLAKKPENIPVAPVEVTDWLGKLFLLNGVPLNYMIPHENYLAARKDGELVNESLGTFYIDYDWMEALLGGALSIIPEEDTESLLNMLKIGKFLPENIEVNKKAAETIPFDEGKAFPAPKTTTNHITGFLLRSELISGWKGIKIFPRNAAGEWMKFPLRIERVAGDIQLCLFAGKVQEVVLIQPPEGIHFGVGQGNGVSFKKYLRNAEGHIVDNVSVDMGMRNGSRGVVDLAKAAASMRKEYKAIGKKDVAYSSADLAFQLLDGPVMYTLQINDRDKIFPVA